MSMGEGPLVWLVSYPKSGSTWLRAMLTALVTGSDATPDLNALLGGTELHERQCLDDWCAINSAEMAHDQLPPYIRTMRLIAGELGEAPVFVKTHDRYGVTHDGLALFPAQASRAVIYIVRHPFDVTVSLAAHYGSTLDQAVERMGDSGFGLNLDQGRGNQFLPVEIGRWGDHVADWLDQSEIPTLLVRYEDMLANPASILSKVAAISGLEVDESAIEAAVRACSFDRLQAAEQHAGFAEKPAGMTRFFRSGAAGHGAAALRDEQRALIRNAHADVMRRLGYPATNGRAENVKSQH